MLLFTECKTETKSECASIHTICPKMVWVSRITEIEDENHKKDALNFGCKIVRLGESCK